jgi:pectate lyase
MVRSFLCLGLLAGVVSAATDPEIWGFGGQTTGGDKAPKDSIYTVTNFNDLRKALDNNGKPDEPKIIYIGESTTFNLLYRLSQSLPHILNCGIITHWEYYRWSHRWQLPS